MDSSPPLSRGFQLQALMTALEDPFGWQYAGEPRAADDHFFLQHRAIDSEFLVVLDEVVLPGDSYDLAVFSLSMVVQDPILDLLNRKVHWHEHSVTVVEDLPCQHFSTPGLPLHTLVLHTWRRLCWMALHPDGMALRKAFETYVAGRILQDFPDCPAGTARLHPSRSFNSLSGDWSILAPYVSHPLVQHILDASRVFATTLWVHPDMDKRLLSGPLLQSMAAITIDIPHSAHARLVCRNTTLPTIVWPDGL